VTDCAELDEREIRRLVAAELGAIPVEERAPDVTLVTIRCGGLRVQIRVDDPLSKKVVLRSFDTGPIDRRARARWIALAASELVLSSWIELESNPAPAAPAEGPPPPAPLLRAAQAAVRRKAPPSLTFRDRNPPIESLQVAREPVPTLDTPKPRNPEGEPSEFGSFRIVGVASMRSFFDGTGELWGAGMRASNEPLRLLSWSADFLFEAGPLTTAGRTFAVRSATLGGWLMLYQRTKALTARIGTGIRAGVVASLEEEQFDSRANAVAPWGWPLLATSVSLSGGPLVFEIGAEGGYVAMPLGDATGPTAQGTWFSAQAGIGIRR
jgi:hypothetical protein